ncbi:hypothetical protein OESDEN_21439 [Oesophagostomum dentatum]|uniref:Uncharacterized protein n=1 Tax=Oesophagostomum dentatum TaxID=61180 RepID=A0A0B1S606_OESDE|nr:hypothetical protein OESDEN_21439 [Oesophagostomum dentatum]
MKTAREISHSMTANSLKSAEEVVPEDTVAAEKQITVGGIKEAEKPAVVVISKDAPMDTMSTQLSILSSDFPADNPSSRTISFATRDETEATQASDSTKQVDLNDFILKAAADNLIVHPSLVTKKGNIDTTMFRAKTKEEIMELDEAMKSGPSSERERPAQPVQKDKNSMQKPVIKWGDSKSVLYETTSQPTYDDDEVIDEPDLYLC